MRATSAAASNEAAFFLLDPALAECSAPFGQPGAQRESNPRPGRVMPFGASRVPRKPELDKVFLRDAMAPGNPGGNTRSRRSLSYGQTNYASTSPFQVCHGSALLMVGQSA